MVAYLGDRPASAATDAEAADALAHGRLNLPLCFHRALGLVPVPGRSRDRAPARGGGAPVMSARECGAIIPAAGPNFICTSGPGPYNSLSAGARRGSRTSSASGDVVG